MQYAVLDGGIGNSPINLSMGPDTTEKVMTGTIATANDSYWGCIEVVYGRATANIRMGGVCTLAPVWDSTAGRFRTDVTEIANTANLGTNVAIATSSMTVGQFGWFAISGIVPVNCTASLAVGAVPGIVAAGQAGANSAGKQLLKTKGVATSSTTVAKANCVAASASRRLTTPGAEGWFIGVYLSGTGIAAGTTVVSIDPDNRTVTLSADTTAQINGTVTATYNNATVYYNIVHINRPFAQGAIT